MREGMMFVVVLPCVDLSETTGSLLRQGVTGVSLPV